MKSIIAALTSAGRSSWAIAAAGQHDQAAELRYELRQIGDVAVHSGEFDDRIAVAGDVERRYSHRYAVEPRQQFPIPVLNDRRKN